ncbi:MAG: YchF/TatD family DNA exonuclease [Magnetococcales bacterium]|nr:YchF/TatD family DNA exonuclease [Magnetococcales bacterium]
MFFADSHAHLNFSDFAKDLDATIERSQEDKVRFINTISTKLEEVDDLLKICARYPGIIYTSAGIHPHNADKADDYSLEAIMAQGTKSDKVVAIGETGFDFHYDFSSRERQELVFRNHVRAAVALDLPLIIHTREADEKTKQVMEEEGAKSCGGVIHCFTGDQSLAQWALDQGFYISFSGILTFKNATSLHQIAANTPLERLLIETDAPYLAPVPFRGKRNEPAYVIKIAEKIAALKNISLQEVAKVTTQNYQKLFRIGSGATETKAEVLAYPIGKGLYINLTKGCTLHCGFCPKWESGPVVHDYDLTLNHTPKAEEVLRAMGDFSGYEEIVFCGFGEPTLRLEVLLQIATEVKKRGNQRVRINTDGLANRVYQQDITPRFKGLIDALSISLNAHNEAVYNQHCQPAFPDSYAALLDFIRCAKRQVPDVTATAVDGLEGVDIAACQHLAEEVLGVKFRRRFLNRVG